MSLRDRPGLLQQLARPWRWAAACTAMFLGTMLWFLVYQSWSPAFAGGLAFLFGLFVLTPAHRLTRSTYVFHFSIFWLAAAVAAVSRIVYGDYSQIGGDAAWFYQLSAAPLLSFDEIYTWSDGAVATVLWHYLYQLSHWIGLGDGPYIGISTNVVLMSWTGALCVYIARISFGAERAQRLASIFPFSGLFWLFSGIHIRDAAVTFSITLLIALWARFFARRTIARLVLVAATTAASPPLFYYLRLEFFYVPLAVAAVALISIPLEWKPSGRGRINTFIGFLSAPLLGAIALMFGSQAVERMTMGRESYDAFTAVQIEGGSLGAIVVNAPILVRAILGPIYLFIYPVPFWTTLTLDSAYQMFKSLNAVFVLLWAPSLALAMLRFVQRPYYRTATAWLLLMTFWGFTFSVALSSLETRHWGAFLPLGILFSMIPDYHSDADRRGYRKMLSWGGAGIALVYALWAILKFA